MISFPRFLSFTFKKILNKLYFVVIFTFLVTYGWRCEWRHRYLCRFQTPRPDSSMYFMNSESYNFCFLTVHSDILIADMITKMQNTRPG